MSDWPDLDMGPIRTWPGTLRRPDQREVSRFKTTVSNGGYARRSTPLSTTLADLTIELRELGAKNVEMLVAIAPQDFRLDGKPRATARVAHPGVILTFDARKIGRLSYAADKFTTWQDNLRGIALGLKALRTFERYGVGKDNQQYRAYLALEATAMPAGFDSPSAAGAFIKLVAGYDLDETPTPRLIRDAKRNAHPDTGGDADTFQRVTLAEQYLKQNGALQ